MTLWCDGGVAGKNPSPLGGSWAWCLVADDTVVRWATGFVQPADIGTETVSNNVTELLAALFALEAMDRQWKGVLTTDSWVTKCRLQRTKAHKLPSFARERIMWLRQNRWFRGIGMVKGHPTEAELRNGIHANGSRVSKWNVWCDRLCGKTIREFLKRKAKSIK